MTNTVIASGLKSCMAAKPTRTRWQRLNNASMGVPSKFGRLSVAWLPTEKRRNLSNVARDAPRFILGECVHDLPVIRIDICERLPVSVLDDETARDPFHSPRRRKTPRWYSRDRECPLPTCASPRPVADWSGALTASVQTSSDNRGFFPAPAPSRPGSLQ